MRNVLTLPLVIALIGVIVISDKSDVTVEGFSIGSRTTVSLTPSPSLLLKTCHPSLARLPTRPASSLRVKEVKSEVSKDFQNGINRFQGICKRATNKCATQLIRFWFRSRRSVLTLCGAMLLWFGAAGAHTPVSHASSMTSSTTRNIFSSSLDQMVDKYVKGHMFDDDAYDPVESIYKEAMDDRVKGTYPRDLKETTSSVLGQDVVKAERKGSGAGVSGILMKSVGFLRKQGLSEMQAIGLLTGLIVFGFPAFVLSAGMQIGNRSRRSMNKVMKKRYGETYSVDATEKVEEDVDVPDDDENDDDDDE
uniref:Uncharacterized protein n=1 Tax=Pseudo-nitzschia australis TaxID=44445 RepID=A0A7S4AAU3_9STRA